MDQKAELRFLAKQLLSKNNTTDVSDEDISEVLNFLDVLSTMTFNNITSNK